MTIQLDKKNTYIDEIVLVIECSENPLKMVLNKIKSFHDSIKKRYFNDSAFLYSCLHFCQVCFIEHDRLSFKIKFLLLALYYSSILVNCSGAAISFINIPDVIKKIEILLIFSLHFSSFVFFIYFKLATKKIWTMFQQPFKADSPLYVGQEAVEITSQILKRSVIVLAVVNSGIVLSSTLVTFGCVLFTNMDDSGDDTSSNLVKYFMPYWFECGQRPIVKFCLDDTNGARLWVINLAQILCSLYEANLNLSLLLFYLILTSGVEAKAEIFKMKLATLSKQISHMDKSKAKYLNEKFGEIVRYQIEIRKFVGELPTLINFPMFLHVQSFYALMVLAAFLSITNGTDNILILIKTTYFIVLGSVFHYVICQNSMIISNMNQNLIGSLMDFPWYEQDKKFRKSYLLTLSVNQKPIIMKLYGLYHVDLQYFASNMRRIYSLLNILLLLQRWNSKIQ